MTKKKKPASKLRFTGVTDIAGRGMFKINLPLWLKLCSMQSNGICSLNSPVKGDFFIHRFIVFYGVFGIIRKYGDYSWCVSLLDCSGH